MTDDQMRTIWEADVDAFRDHWGFSEPTEGGVPPIVESIRELVARGTTGVALGVHTRTANGAYELYAGLGYEVVSSTTIYRKRVEELSEP